MITIFNEVFISVHSYLVGHQFSNLRLTYGANFGLHTTFASWHTTY